MLQDRTEEQKNIQKLIIKELIARPQMPVKLLTWVLNEKLDQAINEKDCEILVADLEYRWSIEWRVSVDFLKEQENINIKIILDAIKTKLWEKVATLSLWELEDYLESALLRKWKLDGDIEQDVYKPWGTTYIDKLLHYTNNQIENGKNNKNIWGWWIDKDTSWTKKEVVKTIPKKS